MKSWNFLRSILVILVLVLSSCANQTQKSLERVAKDWSMTVRASQVMPLYPLEEDIRPGDVYLIDRTIDSEIKSWNKKGFLPLINRYDRIKIPSSEYDEFYKNAFAQSEGASFSRAPKAAFPSYSFKVDRRGALGLAIPLSSVPLALSASGAQEATGNVVFKKAATQGLPDLKMEEKVDVWAKENKQNLADRAQATDNPLILRVITRVFTISEVDVTLSFASALGANFQVGSPPTTPELWSASTEDHDKRIEYLNKRIELIEKIGDPPTVEVPEKTKEIRSDDPEIAALQAKFAKLKILKAEKDLEAYKRWIERKSMIDQFGGYLLPGAAVKFVSRSERGISLKETFDKPLVLGYWATEYFVDKWGELRLLGQVKDLVDNQEEYKRLVKRAKDIAEAPTERPVIDDPEKNPFQEQ